MVKLLFGFAGEMRLDAADLHPYIVLRNAEHRRHFLVAEPVQHQQRQGPVNLAQLPDLPIEPLDARVRRRRRLQNRELHPVQQWLSIAMLPLLSGPRDGRVQCYPINPRSDCRLTTKVGDRSPHLRCNLLKQVLLVLRREGICAHHFEEKPPVALQPIVEHPLLVVIHRTVFLVFVVYRIACELESFIQLY